MNHLTEELIGGSCTDVPVVDYQLQPIQSEESASPFQVRKCMRHSELQRIFNYTVLPILVVQSAESRNHPGKEPGELQPIIHHYGVDFGQIHLMKIIFIWEAPTFGDPQIKAAAFRK